MLAARSLPVHAGWTNVTWSAEVALRETWDSNVYLQNYEPDETKVPPAAEPFVESFVSSVTPKLGLDFKPCRGFGLTASYAPEATFYHAASSEDYVAHRIGLNAGGRVDAVQWQSLNSFTQVQGSREGLYFGAPGGAPAIGGIPIRDRREQFVYRGKLNATWSIDSWFLRPVASAYVHDFQTEVRNPNDPTQPLNRYYENYIDRREMNAGLDFGRTLAGPTKVFAGYRYGLEIEAHAPGSLYHYDARYHRPVVGIEGQPVKWILANVSLGPDIHQTIHEPDPRFDPNYTTLWVDAVVTLVPTTNDTVVLTWKANTQPAFASTSVYDDITYDLTAKHQFDPHWAVSAGFRLYIGDWFAPVTRDDWIHTLSAGVAYKRDAHWSVELGYSYDWVESQVPNTPGREFTRNLVWLGARWVR